ncbi:MAG TPA: L-threonylcarbamoyladenylate synthase [Vicinamibacteria bacterium]|nr:L-threonylcarbamoyladenylate synthase [Vicinamibacteria bacterium]
MGAGRAGGADLRPADRLSRKGTPLEVLPVDGRQPDPGVVARAAAVLARGLLLVYPTDTLYALGGRALDPTVSARVRAAKGRDDGKPLPVIAADEAQARTLAAAWGGPVGRLAVRFWPGPLTLVLPSAPSVPRELNSGTGTIAVRVPDLALARALCQAAGPLVSTSANLSGQAPPRTCAEAVGAVGPAAALALDGGPGREAASTIVSLAGPEPVLVRAGAVAWEDVRATLAAGR